MGQRVVQDEVKECVHVRKGRTSAWLHCVLQTLQDGERGACDGDLEDHRKYSGGGRLTGIDWASC